MKVFTAEMLRISLMGDLRLLYISSREEKLHYSATQSMPTAMQSCNSN
jgi:hypothetical protein